MKKLARLCKALADENRLRILQLLSCGELCVCDLMAALNLPQSTVSRHLATLRASELVEDRRQGMWMFYRLKALSPERQALWSALMEMLANQSSAQSDRQALAEYLAGKDERTCS